MDGHGASGSSGADIGALALLHRHGLQSVTGWVGAAGTGLTPLDARSAEEDKDGMGESLWHAPPTNTEFSFDLLSQTGASAPHQVPRIASRVNFPIPSVDGRLDDETLAVHRSQLVQARRSGGSAGWTMTRPLMNAAQAHLAHA